MRLQLRSTKHYDNEGENRLTKVWKVSSALFQVVVIIIMVAISLLFIYMSFLLCLDPIMNQNSKSTPAAATTTTTSATRQARNYERQINEEVNVDNPTQECVFSEPAASGLQNSRQRSSTVLNLVTQEQSKWRKNVGHRTLSNRPCRHGFSV